MADLRISNEALGVKKFKEMSNETITDRYGDRVCLIKGRLYKSAQCRCLECKKQFPIYDTPTRNRCWRTLDVFDMPTYIVMDIHQVFCPEHGIVTEDIPFALPGSNLPFPLNCRLHGWPEELLEQLWPHS